MSVSSRLSVETWQTILRYAISVPDFLDPDAFEGALQFVEGTSPMNNEDVYWSAEDTRSQLQRVSKPWDAYMRRFEHRFVRMQDVCHARFPPHKLEKAVRISFVNYDCFCKRYCYGSGGTSYAARMHMILSGVESMEAAIADLERDEPIAVLTHHSPKLQYLKTIIASHPQFYSYSASKVVGSLPRLRHIHAKELSGPTLYASRATVSHNVVTAAFSIRSAGKYDKVALNLPSLRYLRLDVDEVDIAWTFARPAILSILRILGRRLLSFHLSYSPMNNEELDELWDLCPSMESFRTAFPIGSPPSPSHPIHTLIIEHTEQLEGLRASEWPNLRRVVLLWPWSMIGNLGDVIGSLGDTIQLEDEEGVTLDQYLAPAKTST